MTNPKDALEWLERKEERTNISMEENGGVIYERSYHLALEMAFSALDNIRSSGKRVSNFQISEVKKEDGRCYYKVVWEQKCGEIVKIL